METEISEFSNTLERIYGAARDESLLDVVLDTISAQIPGVVLILLAQDTLHPSENFILHRGLKSDAVYPVMSSLAVGNCWLDRLWLQKCGEVFHDDDLASHDALVESKKAGKWNELMGPMVRTTGMVINRFETRQLVLEIRFPEAGEAKSRRVATKLLERLGPHLVCAANIMQTNLRSFAGGQMASNVIELFPFPMVIVDTNCKVYGINSRAKVLADRMETFFISADGEFHAVDLDTQLRLRKVVELIGTGVQHRSEIVSLPSYDKKGQTLLSLMKLNNHIQRRIGSKDVCEKHGSWLALVFQDTKEPLELSHRALWNAFKLTNAESELASLLVKGFSVGECAHQQHLAKQTLRNHLGSIMKKTQTHRQPQLVALLTRVALSTMH